MLAADLTTSDYIWLASILINCVCLSEHIQMWTMPRDNTVEGMEIDTLKYTEIKEFQSISFRIE